MPLMSIVRGMGVDESECVNCMDFCICRQFVWGKGTIIGKNKAKYWFIALQNEFLKAQILLEN